MLNQSFTDAVYHLGKFVTEYQTCILEVIMTDDTALIHLIPRDLYNTLSDDEEDEDYEED